MKLLSTPTFSLLSIPNFLKFRSKQGAWRREERRSKHSDPSAPIRHKRQSTLSVSDPSTARRMPIQAHRSATSADPLSLSPLVCLCVGVFGFVVSLGDFVVDFMVDFLFLWLIFYFICGSVCIRGRSR